MSTSEAEQSSRDAILLGKLEEYLRSDDLQKKLVEKQYLRCWLTELRLVTAKSEKHGRGELVWRFPVQKELSQMRSGESEYLPESYICESNEYLNPNQQYAGGAQAAVHDACTGWTLLTISRPDYWANLGATRTLNMSYLKASQVGDLLRMECKIVHIGSRMAMIRGVLTRESNGEVISTSEHHLHNNDKCVAAM